MIYDHKIGIESHHREEQGKLWVGHIFLVVPSEAHFIACPKFQLVRNNFVKLHLART